MLRLPELAAGRGIAELGGLEPLRDRWRDALIAKGAARAALYFADTLDFSAALLGTWAAGCTAVIPGDATELTAAGLSGSADAFLGEFPAQVSPWREPPAAPAAAAKPFPALPLVIHTSGSTGKPVAVRKAAADIENELASLEAAFGSDLDGTRILATVSHQHIYGLLFRCLWPLAAGRPCPGRLIRFPEELEESLADGKPSALVASPAFLRRLPEAPARDWGRSLRAVFSSGGPLPWEAAQACARDFGRPPVEVYGSSETGGIAWRRRIAEDQTWAPFPGMGLALGDVGNLVMTRSPHVTDGLPFATSDRVELSADGSFRLLGRGDRIVKVEEKRLSLAALEALLAEHPRVAEARALLLPGERETLAAVLRMKDGPLPVRGSRARGELMDSLRRHLLRGFDRTVHPKRWRLVESLPADAQGKSTQALLAALFEPQCGPVILDTRHREDGATVLHLHMPAELEHFRGHFPQAALLPGVVQIDWAIREGARLYGPFGPFQSLRAVKFKRPITPGMRVRLELWRPEGKSSIAFHYASDEGSHASGQAVFSPAAPAAAAA